MDAAQDGKNAAAKKTFRIKRPLFWLYHAHSKTTATWKSSDGTQVTLAYQVAVCQAKKGGRETSDFLGSTNRDHSRYHEAGRQDSHAVQNDAEHKI